MRVHHITSGRSDKNLGKAVNDIVKLMDDEDWICLRDIDSMPSYHEKFFEQVEGIAENSSFGLVGCMTNRSGMVEQLHGGKCSIDTDWRHHRMIGKHLNTKYGNIVTETQTTIAGVMMLFSKKVWNKVGGWKEGSIRINGSFVDWHFCNDVINAGYKIGIAQGIYMIHMYRPDHDNPRGQTKHLETN